MDTKSGGGTRKGDRNLRHTLELKLLVDKFDKSQNVKSVIQGVLGFEVVNMKDIAEIHVTRGVTGAQVCVRVFVCVCARVCVIWGMICVRQ